MDSIGQLSRNQVIQFLQQDILRHLAHLKYLERYGDAVTCQYFEIREETGVLLRHAATLSEWDQQFYPDAAAVLLPVASGPQIADALTAEVQRQFGDAPLALKFSDALTRDAFLRAFPRLTPARSYVSYTMSPDAAISLAWSNQVVIASHADEALTALYARNGYNSESVAHYFEHGSQSFTIYEGRDPVCSCMTFHNFGAVWEIGGVHTVEAARGRGYGKQVVAAALHALLTTGRIPRYQVASTNTASIRLAESVGMMRCLLFEHYHIAKD